MTNNNPNISITVIAYNSAGGLRDCLHSVVDDVRVGFAELLIVDNASPDESASIVAEEFPEAKLISSGKNLGFAGGCNRAWPHAKGAYWLLLNPDVIVPIGGLKGLATWMDKHPRVGAASPQLRGDDGRLQSTAAPIFVSCEITS